MLYCLNDSISITSWNLLFDILSINEIFCFPFVFIKFPKWSNLFLFDLLLLLLLFWISTILLLILSFDFDVLLLLLITKFILTELLFKFILNFFNI